MTNELNFAVEEMEDLEAPHQYYIMWGTIIFAVSATVALILYT